MMISAMFATGAGLVIFPLLDEPLLLMGLAFILGLGLGGAQPMIMSLLYNKAPAGRGGEAIGVRTLLLNFSQTGIPLLFGALGAALGMAPVFWTMAFALLAGGWYATCDYACGAPKNTRPAVAPARPGRSRTVGDYLRCLLTSLVISNIDTWRLPPNTSLSLSSALIMRLFLLSCRLLRLM
jgi:MFS family permease